MIRKTLWLLVVVGVIGLLGLSAVAAQEAGVSRSLPAGPVAPGYELDVTISNVGLTNGFGSAKETLPAGFSYVEGSAVVTVGAASALIHHAVEDQTDIFTLLGVDSFTYKVAVGSEVGDGQHTFSGVLKKGLSDEAETIGGDDSVTVEAGTTTPPDTGTPEPPPAITMPGDVSRSLPAGPVAPGYELDVTISNVGLTDGFGSAEETLPAGFSYVEGSAVVTVGAASAVIDHTVEDQTYTFTLLGVDSFTYKVAVGSEVGDGQHTFSGVLKKGLSDEAETIGGDDSVTVEAGTTTPPRHRNTWAAWTCRAQWQYRTCRAQWQYRTYRARGRYRTYRARGRYRTRRARGRHRCRRSQWQYRTCRAQWQYRTCRARGRYRTYRARGRYRTRRARGRHRCRRSCRP